MRSTATTALPEKRARTFVSDLAFTLQASRPGLWLTSIWFYMLPLGGRSLFHSAPFWLGLVYVTFPMGLLLYGWNDYVDFEVDRVNPRKGSFLFGARGSIEQLHKLPMRIAAVQAVFLLALSYSGGPRILLCFAGMVAAAAVYNWPRYGFKSRPPFEILNQAGYLFVFLLSSWMNHVPLMRWPAWLFGALFAMHSHVFGEIMDIEPDRDSDRRTTAVAIGRVPAKLLIAAFLVAETVLLYAFFRDPLLVGFLLASALWFVLDAALLWRDRPYTPGQMRFAMIAWNAIALASMPWVWWKASFTVLR
ncbi:MAG TPA: UbiA family prenyltransferase [Candidatus Angelobacter sp.]|nr:UbiA family prenyltransferase [Candidatus Angelobacter sp.]